MKVLGIIPARYESERFPGKPLADIAGKSMIRRVFEQAEQSKSLNDLIVATNNQKIFDEVKSFGGKVMMTGDHCKNGTERCVNLIKQLPAQFDIVINIQGDEPLLNPDQIDQLVSLFDKDTAIVTLAHELLEEELNNSNIAKVALDKFSFALGFSRDYEFIRNHSDRIFKHIGLYGFKAKTLLKIVNLQPTPNEIYEKLEQLRWLDHGFKINVGITRHQNFSVDVPNDIEKILRVLQNQ